MTPFVPELFAFTTASVFAGLCILHHEFGARYPQKGPLPSETPCIGFSSAVLPPAQTFSEKRTGVQSDENNMRLFLIIPARDSSLVSKKIVELERLGYPYLIVCGERVDHVHVVHRPPRGKYDALNFGVAFLPTDTDVVVFNDVDTEIRGFDEALRIMKDQRISLTYAKVDVVEGPQRMFYLLLDFVRRRIPVAASGELMLIRRDALLKMIPLKACKAEDTYILFKVLEKGERAVFCENCHVTTKRTMTDKEEEEYKRRTVGGIYQALAMTNPPATIKFAYVLLPFASPLLLILGTRGFYWMKGILAGFMDYAKGDVSGSWKATYGNKRSD